MQYPDAKHQNMAGVTHPVAFVQELLHKVKQANANSPLESSTDISQAMRDALSPDGPSPAITFGDNIHWRVMLISARRKHVDFVDPFGTGFLTAQAPEQQGADTHNLRRLQPPGSTAPWVNHCPAWKYSQYEKPDKTPKATSRGTHYS